MIVSPLPTIIALPFVRVFRQIWAVTFHLLNNLSEIHVLLWLIVGYPTMLTAFSIAWYLNGKT
jgi:hypothetical protein